MAAAFRCFWRQAARPTSFLAKSAKRGAKYTFSSPATRHWPYFGKPNAWGHPIGAHAASLVLYLLLPPNIAPRKKKRAAKWRMPPFFFGASVSRPHRVPFTRLRCAMGAIPQCAMWATSQTDRPARPDLRLLHPHICQTSCGVVEQDASNNDNLCWDYVHTTSCIFLGDPAGGLVLRQCHVPAVSGHCRPDCLPPLAGHY